MRRRAEATGIGMVAFAVIVWGCVGRVIAEGSPHADPLMLTGLRAAPAAIVLLIALPLLRRRLPSTRDVSIRTAISGLLMVTWFLYGLTESVAKAGPGTAIVLLSTSPFFIILAERYVYGKRVTRAMLLGMVVGFGGIVLIVSGQLGASRDAGEMLVGIALAISAAFAWSMGTLIVADQINRDPETDLVGLTTGQYMIGGSVLLVLAFAIEGTRGGGLGLDHAVGRRRLHLDRGLGPRHDRLLHLPALAGPRRGDDVDVPVARRRGAARGRARQRAQRAHAARHGGHDRRCRRRQRGAAASRASRLNGRTVRASARRR